MYNLFLIVSVFSSVFANHLTDDVDDSSSTDTAFVDPAVDFGNPYDLLLQNDFIEAVNPAPECSLDADAEESNGVMVMKRGGNACASRYNQNNLMSEKLKSDLQEYQIIVRKRVKKLSRKKPPGGLESNDQSISTTDVDSTCASYGSKSIHVTCGGPEYGWYSAQWILWVIDCVAGFRTFT